MAIEADDKLGEVAAPPAAPENAVSDAEYRAKFDDIPSVTETNENAVIYGPMEYFKALNRPNTRPAFWKWRDVKAKLDELAKEPLIEAERRFCITVNADTEELVGTTPFNFIGWQVIHPGEEIPPHRHSSFAIYHILQGEGYTTVQETGGEWKKYHWEKGDTLTCPAWAYHAHYALGDEDTIQYVVQDAPMMAAARLLFWEEPMGIENFRQLVEGTSRSWSTTRKDV